MLSSDAHVQLLRTTVTNYRMRFASGSKSADKPREILSTGTDARVRCSVHNCGATVVWIERSSPPRLAKHATSVIKCGTARVVGGSLDL